MFSVSSASALSISTVPVGVPTHSSNGNQSASRKRLKLGQLPYATNGEVRQNWRVLYKNAFGGRSSG
jgi:hypothetical protein